MLTKSGAGSGYVAQGTDMANDNPTEYYPATVVREARSLAVMGIVFAPPAGCVSIRNDWATIGTLIAGNAPPIVIVPCEDIAREHYSHLIAVAADALRDCTPSADWVPSGDLEWVTTVEIPCYFGGINPRARSSLRSSSVGGASRVSGGGPASPASTFLAVSSSSGSVIRRSTV